MVKQARDLRGGFTLLPVQPGLDHRGGFGLNVASLFPPSGTYEALGGREAIARLVDRLYDRFETDPVLRPAFSRDLTHERERVKRFFQAWFGGSSTYFDAGWPPGLQAAHGPVSISRGMAGRWVGHFLDAFAEVAPDPNLVHQIKPIISRLAMGLVNRSNEPVTGEPLRDSCYGVDERLLQSVQRDDAEGVAISAAALPQMIQRYGPRLLLIAAVRGKARAAQALLRQGVDANAVAMLPGSEANAFGLPMLHMTPLCAALARGRESVVSLLVEYGAQYDLFTAAFVGDLKAVRELLEIAPELADGSDPACDLARITPLMHAVYAGQFEVAQILLQRGATVGANSVRLVRAAANAGQEALTDLLLEHGAEPTEIGAGTWVLYPAIADKLLARGANVNAQPGAWIGLCCTGNSGHKQNAALARALLHCGADVTAWYKGRTAIHCAAKAGFLQVVEALIEYGGDVNAPDERGLTPLDAVEEAGKSIDPEPMRRLLISYGARRSKQITPADELVR